MWILGAEVLAFDVGRSPQAEEDTGVSAGSGGQFEFGVVAEPAEAAHDVEFGFGQ